MIRLLAVALYAAIFSPVSPAYSQGSAAETILTEELAPEFRAACQITRSDNGSVGHCELSKHYAEIVSFPEPEWLRSSDFVELYDLLSSKDFRLPPGIIAGIDIPTPFRNASRSMAVWAPEDGQSICFQGMGAPLRQDSLDFPLESDKRMHFVRCYTRVLGYGSLLKVDVFRRSPVDYTEMVFALAFTLDLR